MTVVDLNCTKRTHKRAPRDPVPIDKTGGAARFFDRMAAACRSSPCRLQPVENNLRKCLWKSSRVRLLGRPRPVVVRTGKEAALATGLEYPRVCRVTKTRQIPRSKSRWEIAGPSLLDRDAISESAWRNDRVAVIEIKFSEGFSFDLTLAVSRGTPRAHRGRAIPGESLLPSGIRFQCA
jgi:hypothetical protein